MRIILFGSNGMLGTYLNSYLSKEYEVLALTRADIDLTTVKTDEFLNFIEGNVTSDDIIINASGIIKQRDYNVAEMIVVNSLFPHILAEVKNITKCQVIHITTDCVFSGKKGGYLESDYHDCLDDYGKTKSLGESKKLTIIRTSIIGEEKNNKRSLLEWVRSNKGGTIDGYYNHFWNGVTCLELAKYIETIIKDDLFWVGVRHIFSPNTVSKFNLVSMINEIYDLKITINRKNMSDPCFRNLSSSFKPVITNSLYNQILEMKNFKL